MELEIWVRPRGEQQVGAERGLRIRTPRMALSSTQRALLWTVAGNIIANVISHLLVH